MSLSSSELLCDNRLKYLELILSQIALFVLPEHKEHEYRVPWSQPVIDNSGPSPLPFAGHGPPKLSKAVAARNDAACFRVLCYEMLKFPVLIVGQSIQHSFGEYRGLNDDHGRRYAIGV